jgi:carboxyl-terminal processing protease
MRSTSRNILSSSLIFLLSLALVTSLSSCRKELSTVNAVSSYPGDNYPDIFESFWNGMNNNYVFWSIDTTNWDRVYTTYKPLFANLKTFDSSSSTLAEKYFTDMTAGLIDSHYTLTFELNGNLVSPAYNRKVKLRAANPDSIYSLPNELFTSYIPQKYIDKQSLKKGTDSIMLDGSIMPFTAITGTINNNVLYFYFNSFSFSQAGKNVTPILNTFFNTIANLPATVKGIVIDMRGNGGGEVNDLNYLVGRMITKPLTVGYTRAKNGIGRLDYTPWAPAIVTPQAGAVNIIVPIIALADHFSVSMAELTTMAIKTLPNGKFIGTTTWGANGPLAPGVYFNGGQFTVGSSSFGNKGYMFVYTSSTMFKYLNGNIYEGKGVPPDIWVPESAYDSQLDAAIRYIQQH